MAGAAEQRAPLRLLPQDVEAPRETAARDLEPLRRRIDVMKLQRAGIPGVPADHAPAPRLGDEDLFRATTPGRHALDIAGAAEIVTTLPHQLESRPAVPPALPDDHVGLVGASA